MRLSEEIKGNFAETTTAESTAQEESTGVTIDMSDLSKFAMDFARSMGYTQALKLLGGEISTGRKYTKEQIQRFLDSPDKSEDSLRDLSLWMFINNPQYMRIILYFYTMLTLDYIVAPYGMADYKMTDRKFKKAYESAVSYVNAFNIKHEFSKIIFAVLLEGAFYGYEVWNKDKTNMTIMQMPSKFCRVAGTVDGVLTYEFNFSYFDINKDLLDNYPPDFKKIYGSLKGSDKWVMLDPASAPCFKFDETKHWSIPPFASIIEDALDLRDFKDLFKGKTELENIALLVQKIPMKKDPKSEKDYVLSLNTVGMFHNNIKMGVPKQIGVVSTPMDLDAITFGDRAQQKDDISSIADSNFYSSAGTSKLLFGSEGSPGRMGLDRSIQNDESIMFKLLRQFERFFRFRFSLGAVGNTRGFLFSVIFPDLTIYNRGEMLDKYLKAATHGFPVSFVAAAIGVRLDEVVNLIALEQDYYNLKDIMKPLLSSHTQSASGDGGRPAKADGELKDAGIETRANGSNENR